MADWRDTYWSFTVALQESEDIEVPIEFFYDEDGYIAHLIAMKTLTEEEYAQYGKLYSLISTYDKIFIEIIENIIPLYNKIEIYYQELKINYLRSLIDKNGKLLKMEMNKDGSIREYTYR